MAENKSTGYHMEMDDSEFFYADIYSRDFIKKKLTDKLMDFFICVKNNMQINPRSYLAKLRLELEKRGVDINGSPTQLADSIKRLNINIDEIMDSDPDAYYHYNYDDLLTLEDDLLFLKRCSEHGWKPWDSCAGLIAELKKYGLKVDPDTDINQLAENLRLIRQYDDGKRET